jgi:peptidoglycan/LPS O-acetylase OafA/YrhL
MVKGRIPSLDGLRAIAVLAVLFYHLHQSYSLKGLPIVGALADYGWFGVQIFFVISGFLITWLLLVEESQNTGFSLSSFYGRRALRILPPAVFYLLVIACLRQAGRADVSWLDLTASALFFRNLVHGSTETGHYWSLSIEEQFYLLWPFALTAVRNNRHRLALLLALIVAAPIWRHLNYVVAGGAEHVNTDRLDLRCDPLLFGCVLALLRFDERWLTVLRSRFVLNPLTALSATAVLLYGLMGPVPKSLLFLALPAECAAVALLISYLIDRPGGLAGRILNWRPVVWVGTISYSLYIWNELFLKVYPPPQPWIRGFPQNLLATLACSCLSFYCLERPFSRLRRTLFPEAKQRDAKKDSLAPGHEHRFSSHRS